jgi:SAM-dependent methyltransferase
VDETTGAEVDAATARVQRARSLGSRDEVVAVYRDWVEHYDRDVFDLLGVIGSARIAELLGEHQPDRAGAVVDLGCGTGEVGVRLRDLGFTAVDGIDISPEMLAVADGKGCYRSVAVADLTDPTTLPVGRYRSSVSAGTFTTGHVGPGSVSDLVRLHEPEGIIAWVIAQPVWRAFAAAIEAAGVDTLHAALEPIRVDGPPESVMFVGRVRTRT